jgi:hypothetical protein
VFARLGFGHSFTARPCPVVAPLGNHSLDVFKGVCSGWRPRRAPDARRGACSQSRSKWCRCREVRFWSILCRQHALFSTFHGP